MRGFGIYAPDIGTEPESPSMLTAFIAQRHPMPCPTCSMSNEWRRREDSNTSFEAGAQYKFDAGEMLHFCFAEGYRGGGFVGLPGSLAAADYPRPAGKPGGFGPETSRSFELGLKTEFFNRKVLLNLTVFSTIFDDLQRSSVEPNPLNLLLFVIVTRNIAKARMQDVELETARSAPL